MKLLVTMSADRPLPDNVRASHEAAAARWHCDYHVELQRYWLNACYSFSKYPFLCDHDYDRILWLDADILVRSDAPSPFNLVPRTHIGVVDDLQSHHPQSMRERVLKEVHADHYPTAAQFLPGLLTPCGHVSGAQFTHRPFNAGMLIATPQHHAELFQRIAALVPKLPQHLAANGHFEQATLNYAVHAFATPLHYLEQTWNTIHPDVGQPMRSFFYHFTGMDFGERRSRLSDYDWRAVPTGD